MKIDDFAERRFYEIESELTANTHPPNYNPVP